MRFAQRALLRCALLVLPLTAYAQERQADPNATKTTTTAVENASAFIPDAPVPQTGAVNSDLTAAQDSASQDSLQSSFQSSSQDSSSSQSPAQSSSSSQTQTQSGSEQAPAQQTEPTDTNRQKAHEQINEEEHQRVLGIVPMFNTTYHNDAVSLTAKEKMGLAFRSAVDPVTFGVAFGVAGYSEIFNDNSGFGWGASGYFKRAGAAYLDSFNGTIIGNGILPAVLRQDPRYFRMGHGTVTHRLLYSMATTVICKHDNTGKWEPNYSNVGGNLIAGVISTTYYPETATGGVEKALTNGLVVTAEGALGSIFQEFWPDVSRKMFHRDPTHGLDTQAAGDPQDTAKQPTAPSK